MTPPRPGARRQAAVAAGSAAAARSAAEVLAAGGNAADGAVAGGLAAAVAEPGLTSLGGGGFALVREPAGAEHLLDFFVDAPGRGLGPDAREPHFTDVVVQFPSAAQHFHVGWGSVAVPGCLDGYLRLHRDRGRLSLDAVTAPARRLAREGVIAEPAQEAVVQLLHAVLTLTDDGARLFPVAAGAAPGALRLRNPQYADLLAKVAAGTVTGFASEPLLSATTEAMARNGGLVTVADLQAYEPVGREPLLTSFRGARVATNALPSFGGAILADAFAELASLEAGRRSDELPAAPHVVAALAAATARQKQQAVTAVPQSTQGTTHLSVVDGDGLMVSMTTSNGSCSGVFAPGSGVQLNNVMGERDLHPWGFHALPPGTRVGSMMAPTIVDLPDGSVVALGSGGSERIRSALLQTMLRLVAGDDLATAVMAPRVHWDGSVVQTEPGLSADVLASLAATGPVNVWSAPDLYFGGVNAVQRHPDGRVTAVGDPRRGGVALVVPQPDEG